MITGFSLQKHGEHDRVAFLVEPGFQAAFQKHGRNAWLRAAVSQTGAGETMKDIEMATGDRSGELEGFTLFLQPRNGWQMSTRRKGETGWSIEIVSEVEAQRIFAVLGPIDHPDGPFRVVPPADSAAALLLVMEANARARGELNALLAALVAP